MTEHPAAPTLPPHPQSNPRERILSRHLREKASIWDIPPSGGADDFRCVRDGESWPCDAVRLARSDLDEARAAARKEVRPAMWELVHDAAHAGNGYYETCMECMRSVDAILDSLSTDTREEHGDAD